MSLPEYSLRGALHRSSDKTFLKQALRAPKAIKARLGDETERLAKSERPTPKEAVCEESSAQKLCQPQAGVMKSTLLST